MIDTWCVCSCLDGPRANRTFFGLLETWYAPATAAKPKTDPEAMDATLPAFGKMSILTQFKSLRGGVYLSSSPQRHLQTLELRTHNRGNPSLQELLGGFVYDLQLGQPNCAAGLFFVPPER